ncbi:hypothetical protein QYM36_017310, partial [Artemia franciscana]
QLTLSHIRCETGRVIWREEHKLKMIYHLALLFLLGFVNCEETTDIAANTTDIPASRDACKDNYVVVGSSCAAIPCYVADPEDANPCNNGNDPFGKCIPSDDVLSFTCECSLGITQIGDTCGVKDTSAASSSSSSSSSSENTAADTSSGSDICSLNPCQSGGDSGSQCSVDGDGYSCKCSSGYVFTDGTCTKRRRVTAAISNVGTTIRRVATAPLRLVARGFAQIAAFVTFPYRYYSTQGITQVDGSSRKSDGFFPLFMEFIHHLSNDIVEALKDD